ncbi:spheroidene monooxygenase [Yoonia sp. 208BN28-4]|uniref:spheroidene monooxygenase n=1 Tax=Yoonia sp. 208BN28-4 TaxID=3126505 RepID=UPI0030993CC0
MSQVVSLTFFRFDTALSRAWALWMMGAARGPLARTPDIGFWKLCGSGGGEGFTPRINIDTIAILATWPDAQIAKERTETAPIYQKYRAKASEVWTVFMTTDTARGKWSGQTPFAVSNTAETAGMGVLTRATIKPSIMAQFWKRVPRISDRIGSDPHVLFKIGIGEAPLMQQITFSIWPDAKSMSDFAHTGAHADAIRAVRDEGWFREELYARFTLLSDSGTWGGTSPLNGLRP